MPVFDFSNMQAKKEPVRCTYAMVYSDNDHASPENPILVIDNQKREWKHHHFYCQQKSFMAIAYKNYTLEAAR